MSSLVLTVMSLITFVFTRVAVGYSTRGEVCIPLLAVNCVVNLMATNRILKIDAYVDGVHTPPVPVPEYEHVEQQPVHYVVDPSYPEDHNYPSLQ
jgi:hypothetical protein